MRRLLLAATLAVAALGCAQDEPIEFTKDVPATSTGTMGAGGDTGDADASGHGVLSGTRLAPIFWIGDDGSRQPTGWQDTERGERCSVSRTADGALRCIPEALLPNGLFADAECTEPLATAPMGCNIPPAYIARFDTAQCSPRVELYERGPAHTDVVYSGAACVEAPAPPNAQLFRYGPAVPLTAFAEVHESIGVSP